MIRAAVFDVDGTLLDSMDIWMTMGNRYLRTQGKDSDPELDRILYTMSLNQGAEYLRTNYAIKKSRDEIMREIVSMVENFYLHEAKLKPGVKSLLEFLSEKKIPMTVATSSDKSYLWKCFQRLDIDQYFHEIYTCGEYNTNKGNPFIYEKASEHFSCKKEEIYVFEDLFLAAKTAHDAGFTVVGVYDFSSAKETEELKKISKLYVKDFSKISFDQFL